MRAILIITLFILNFFSYKAFTEIRGDEEDYLSKMGIWVVQERIKASDFALKGIDGKKVNLSDYRGKVILLNFWATWCPPCREEMPSLEKIHQEFKKRGFLVLSVSSDVQGNKVVKPFMEEFRLSFPALLDTDSQVTTMYMVRSRPTTFLIDSQGWIIGRAVGPRDWASQDAIRLVEHLLATINR